MYKFVKNKILNSKLKETPFPHIIIYNLLKNEDLIYLSKILPDYNEVKDGKILYQSKSETKKSLLPDSKIYKNLMKKKIFKKLNMTFKEIEPILKNKFASLISKHVVKKFHNSKLDYHMSLSIMKKGYLKSAHTDRRDHLIHGLFYVESEAKKGGNIQLIKLKKREKIFDVFPDKKKIKIFQSYKVKKNFCIFTLNVPWAYHAVSKYTGKTDRKYFYAVYDFKVKQNGARLNNRKKGFNINNFWNDTVVVKSIKRKKTFLSE